MTLRRIWILPFLACALIAQAPVPPVPKQATAATPGPVFPEKDWERVASPETAGFSQTRLNALSTWLKTLDTTAMQVVVGGKVVFEYGDLTRQSYLASARKSVLATLYGKYVENGTIPLGRTLKELDFTDLGGLLPREQDATIEHLLSARSGIYHPASNLGDSTDSAPPRGSQRPGTYYLYNNWDFNAAGALFERLTGKDIYDALENDLAKPIDMQDFDRKLQQKGGDAERSQHSAYHMWFSTRDMARLGLLVAREGNWNGTQVVPKNWVRRMTSVITPFQDMNPPALRDLGTGMRFGYGYMWWVWDAPQSHGPFRGACTAMGAFGQFITVLPALDMVIAHKVANDVESGDPTAVPKNVTLDQYDSILRMLMAARVAPSRSNPDQALMALLKEGKIEEFVRTVEASHKSSPLPPSREEQINLIGYRFLSQKQFPQALAVLGLLTRIFPKSPNAWDSLGEAALAAGDAAQAKACYGRSLELLKEPGGLEPAVRKQLQESAEKALKALDQ